MKFDMFSHVHFSEFYLGTRSLRAAAPKHVRKARGRSPPADLALEAVRFLCRRPLRSRRKRGSFFIRASESLSGEVFKLSQPLFKLL